MHVGEEEKRKAVKKSFDVFDRDAAAADCSCEGDISSVCVPIR